MLALYISLGVIGLLFIILFILLLCLHHSTFYSPIGRQNDDHILTPATYKLGIDKEIYQLIDDLLAVPYIDAYIDSYDGLKLHAKVYKNPTSNKVVIMCHGYRGTAARDFSGGAKLMIDSGYNVILIDERAHGLSKGHNITFGNREKKDVLSWIEYSKQTFGDDKELVLVGISMGAATILFASEFIPGSIKVICDCPYVSEKDIISETIKKMKLSVRFFYPLVNLSSILFSHASLNKDDAFKSLKNTRHKYLIIHGDKDSIVPYQSTEKLYRAYPDKIQYELFPDTDHGLGFVTDNSRYKKIVTDFINQ